MAVTPSPGGMKGRIGRHEAFDPGRFRVTDLGCGEEPFHPRRGARLSCLRERRVERLRLREHAHVARAGTYARTDGMDPRFREDDG